MQGTILLFFTFLSPSWAYQELECFDEVGGGGNSISIEGGESLIDDLANPSYDFDDRIQSCYFSGVFVLYDIKSYNGDHLNVSKYTRRGYCHL